MITATEAQSLRNTIPVTLDEISAEIRRLASTCSTVGSGDFDHRPLDDSAYAQLMEAGFRIFVVTRTNWTVTWIKS